MCNDIDDSLDTGLIVIYLVTIASIAVQRWQPKFSRAEFDLRRAVTRAPLAPPVGYCTAGAPSILNGPAPSAHVHSPSNRRTIVKQEII